MQIDLNFLREIPDNSVYAFIAGKELYAAHSSQSLLEIVKTISELKDGLFRKPSIQQAWNDDKLELKILKSFKPDVSHYVVRAHYTKQVNELVAKGYTDVRSEYNAGTFKLKTEVFHGYNESTPRFYVLACSKRGEKLVLGIFENIQDGKAWIAEKFPGDHSAVIPRFHNNELTANYHNKHGLKLKEA